MQMDPFVSFEIASGKCILRLCFVVLLLVILLHPVPGVAAQDVTDRTSASLVMNSERVWQGESSLMKCTAKPKYTGISKVLWLRRERDGNLQNVFLYNREHPTATGPYKQFSGRISGWMNVGEGTHYLNMNLTLASDTAAYYCIITDDNYVDKISPAKQLTVNVKHFNHSIRVNESSESFSSCEEMTLDSSSDVNEEVTITCTVTSSPKSRLDWRVTADNQDGVFGRLVENCSAYSTNLYTCTSTTTLRMGALTSKRTEVRCQARFQALTHTSDACVTLVYKNFLLPPGALTSAKTRVMTIAVICGIVIFIVVISLAVAIAYMRKRQGRQEDKKKPTLSPSFLKVPADEV